MSKIMDDFIKSARTSCGYGFFETVRSEKNHPGLDVVDYAMKIGKLQLRKYKRYGVIPTAFFSYLKEKGFNIQDIPKDCTIKDMPDLLYNASYQSKSACDYGLSLIEEISINLYPGTRVMYVSGEKLGKDLYKMKNKLSLAKRQGYNGSRKK